MSVWARRALLVVMLCVAGLAHADQVSEIVGARAVETWVRLKGDARGAITYEWVSGTAFGVPADGPAVPLFRMESVTVRRFERQGPAHYLEKNYACRTYRDIGSGEFIDGFINPLTGTEVRLATRCSPGPVIRFTAEKVDLLGGMKFESSALGVPMRLERVSMGDVVVIRRSVRSQFVSPTTGEWRRELSVDSFTLPARSLDHSRAPMLAPAYHWESVGGWMVELGMGERPGRMFWSIFGRSVRTVEELPADFRRALTARVPDALTRPLD